MRNCEGICTRTPFREVGVRVFHTLIRTLNYLKPIFEGCIVFAANIHADGAEPTLYLNENDTDKYIGPLQTKGIKVLLCIMGDLI